MLAPASYLACIAAGSISSLIRLACVVLAASVTTAFAASPARLQEAERLMRAGEYDAAQALLPDLPSQPGDERYRGLMLRAEIALARGDYPRANGLYYQANRAAGHAVAAELGQVRADLQAGEFGRAKAFATLFAGEHRNSPEALALHALLEDRTGQTERALAALRAARAKAPDDVALLGAYAEILIDRGGLREAVSALDAWIGRNRPRGDVYALRARAALAAGDRDEGLRWRARTALAYEGSGERTRAVALYDWLSRADPDGQIVTEVKSTAPPPATESDEPVLLGHDESAWRGPYLEPFPGPVGATVNTGSGFVIDAGHRVVTSAAVVKDTKDGIMIRNGLGYVRRAQVEWVTAEAGLVVLRLTEPYRAAWSIPPSQVAAPASGSLCFVIGYPLADSLDPVWPAVGPGLVFRLWVGEPGRIQITSALGTGSGGSPVFDATGRLIGIALSNPRDAAGGKPGGGNFALSSSLLLSTLEAAGVITHANAQPGPSAATIEEVYERMLPAVVLVVAPQ
jgi:S1-C subfamily serine protease/thioredoxin-like negative regulator of GroEL